MTQYIILSTLTFIKVSMKTFITKLRIYELDELANVLGAFMDGLNILITGIVLTNCSGYHELYTRTLCVIISGYMGSKIAVNLFGFILHTLKDDDKWIYLIIAKSKPYGKEMSDTLKIHGIERYTVEGYYHKSNSLFSIVISNSKEESNIIKSICTKDKCKRLRIN